MYHNYLSVSPAHPNCYIADACRKLANLAKWEHQITSYIIRLALVHAC